VCEAAGVHVERIYAHQLHPFQRESLQWLGFEGDRVVAAERHACVQCDTLLAVSFWDAFMSVPAWACDFLKARFAPQPTTVAPRRIHVSRADAATRHLKNDAAVQAMLARSGFETVTLSGMSMREQVALFAAAEVVVAPHGAGLANIVFCPPEARVIELGAPRYVKGCFFDLACKTALDYRLVPAQGTDRTTDHGWTYQHEDFSVDLAALESAIEGRA
jgi:capsular polysaccharide biosynthesis protein